jgi:hypothetical protein
MHDLGKDVLRKAVMNTLITPTSAHLQLGRRPSIKAEQWDTLCPGTRAPLLLCTLYCKQVNPFLLCTIDAASTFAHSGMEMTSSAVVSHRMTSRVLHKVCVKLHD